MTESQKTSKSLNTSTKMLILFGIISVTIAYSIYHRHHIDQFDTLETPLLLKNIPTIKVEKYPSDGQVALSSLAKKGSGLFVHLWGTWCAPCERELPAFLKFSEKLDKLGVKVVLLAINDKKKDIKKFIKRFKLPSNVSIALDSGNLAMDQLGSAKVPDTYLFDEQGIHLTKFVGPQDWSQKIYYFKTQSLLEGAKNVQNLVIETH
ncbi:MAG: TlpA family protein disulfide reductase [Halobacteriovoraceae bacterium]|jgi:cytochrome c biogenesis protein CcmG, thiol:disulfide interchange protein DsbE|nr:TlpA family protein disulfide reductase [Halobacteriovoraceae bacterium]MBT5092921.1 TlpA family protein disulfide reductase [Halobacteriovoraceae bacterium]